METKSDNDTAQILFYTDPLSSILDEWEVTGYGHDTNCEEAARQDALKACSASSLFFWSTRIAEVSCRN
jgi:hypothetical protein